MIHHRTFILSRKVIWMCKIILLSTYLHIYNSQLQHAVLTTLKSEHLARLVRSGGQGGGSTRQHSIEFITRFSSGWLPILARG